MDIIGNTHHDVARVESGKRLRCCLLWVTVIECWSCRSKQRWMFRGRGEPVLAVLFNHNVLEVGEFWQEHQEFVEVSWYQCWEEHR